MATREIAVPDIGDFKNIPVIEIFVKPGDVVAKDAPLVTLESDKATVEVPSPGPGTIKEVKVKIGDRVSQGSVIVLLEAAEGAAAGPSGKSAEKPPQTSDKPAPTDNGVRTPGSVTGSVTASASPSAAPLPSTGAAAGHAPGAPPAVAPGTGATRHPDATHHADVLVLGSGPGGYTAAFRAADLGKKVVLVERYPRIGGVCLNVGCIPSKALLHAAKVVAETEEMAEHGISFGEPQIDLPALGAWKDSVVDRLTGGLAGLAKQRKVTVVQGTAEFASDHVLKVATADGDTTIGFDNAIIAVGSSAVALPFLPDDPRIIDSTGALALEDVPGRLLVIGGGIIGLEMATVYDALGSEVTVVEALDGLMTGADRDLVRPLQRRVEKRYAAIHLATKVTAVEAGDAGLTVTFEGDDAPEPQTYDRILLAVGRRPNGGLVGAGHAGVAVDERGFIGVDAQRRTNVPHIFAIGDVVGEPMLAHKATHEGKVAAEVIAGENVAFEPRGIPSVAYTDPEVAWIGLTETQAKAQGIPFEKGTFPWAASGRALGLGRDEGLTKLLIDPETRQVIGAGMVGPQAGDLVSEVALAMELGADAEDIGLTIHPHPTLSETVAFSAEAVEGTITDLYVPKRAARRG
jgi:dihydrolipoamide dehydrogenase